MSGNLLSTFYDTGTSSMDFIKLLSCEKEKNVLECLQGRNLNDLMTAQEKIYKDVLPGFLKFGPIFDERIGDVRYGQFKMISQINSIEVPIMMGIDSNEAAYYSGELF
jgi:carboxylesterase type B